MHLSIEQIREYLRGLEAAGSLEGPDGVASGVRAHLEACPLCRREARAIWLSEGAEAAPGVGLGVPHFAGSVLARYSMSLMGDDRTFGALFEDDEHGAVTLHLLRCALCGERKARIQIAVERWLPVLERMASRPRGLAAVQTLAAYLACRDTASWDALPQADASGMSGSGPQPRDEQAADHAPAETGGARAVPGEGFEWRLDDDVELVAASAWAEPGVRRPLMAPADAVFCVEGRDSLGFVWNAEPAHAAAPCRWRVFSEGQPVFSATTSASRLLLPLAPLLAAASDRILADDIVKLTWQVNEGPQAVFYLCSSSFLDVCAVVGDALRHLRGARPAVFADYAAAEALLLAGAHGSAGEAEAAQRWICHTPGPGDEVLAHLMLGLYPRIAPLCRGVPAAPGARLLARLADARVLGTAV
ncbi:MAG: hypothetical protein JXR37_04520 [Kiritimatiellae bacterium]|nr:hypothetical protein [Kiritimatiellia bacterium]